MFARMASYQGYAKNASSPRRRNLPKSINTATAGLFIPTPPAPEYLIGSARNFSPAQNLKRSPINRNWFTFSQQKEIRFINAPLEFHCRTFFVLYRHVHTRCIG